MKRAQNLILILMAASVGHAGSARAADSPIANVIFYDAPPMGPFQPNVVAVQQVPGYTTAAGPYNGNEVTVQRLGPDAAQGFLPLDPLAVPQVLPQPANQYYVGVNQIDPSTSVAFFGLVGVSDPLGVEITPPPGQYDITIQVGFRKSLAATQVQYSIDGGPVKVFAGEPIFITRNTTILYNGLDGVDPGPQKSASYQVTYPDCADFDHDEIPDRIEVQVGLNPLVSERDANQNRRDDLDELIRGADTILPPQDATLFLDGDGDGWSDFDEMLRGTQPADPADFPIAPNLQTVEILCSGTVNPTTPGASTPPDLPPAKPFPAGYQVQVVTPSGVPARPPVATASPYALRTSGEQFHYLLAKAADGTGRALLAPETPRALCINQQAFCSAAASLTEWRQNYSTLYDARIFTQTAGGKIDPRTTAQALLLNRYYEIALGSEFTPGEEGKGPDADSVFDLRAKTNDAALFAAIQGAVTTEMIDLVSDYFRYATSPGPRSMLALLADHFGGRGVPPALVPSGVRIENIFSATSQTAQFFAGVTTGVVELTGTITIDNAGFILTTQGGVFRLDKIADSFVPGTQVTLKVIVNVDACNESIPTAIVVDLVSRTVPPIAAPVDSDGDGLSDDWEEYYFNDLDETGDGDFDDDGLTNEEEYEVGTNPIQPDAEGGCDLAIKRFLLGLDPDSVGLDYNNDGVIDVADIGDCKAALLDN